MKRSLEHIIPAGHAQIRDNILARDNLTGVPERRSLWAGDLDLPREAEHIFFAGCGYQQMKYVEGLMKTLGRAGRLAGGTEKLIRVSRKLGRVGADLGGVAARFTASKEDPYTPVLRSAVSVLRKLGVDVGYLADEEPCCGSPMYYAGFEEEYAERARANAGIFKSLGVKSLIGIVPGCTSALRDVYPRYVEGYDLRVRHILEVIAERLRETEARPALREEVTVAYHDPCQLSRYLRITEEPREIIRSIEGARLLEGDPEEAGRWSTCCGGGGIEATHGDLSGRVGLRRAEELIRTGASIIISQCPGCEMQLRKTMGRMNPEIRVLDLISFLDGALP